MEVNAFVIEDIDDYYVEAHDLTLELAYKYFLFNVHITFSNGCSKHGYHICTYLELIGDALSLSLNRRWIAPEEYVFSLE